MVRRGRDHHLHGQVFLPPGIRRRHSAMSCRTTVHRKERRNSRNQLHASSWPACSSGPSLYGYPASLYDVIFLDCMMSRRRPKDILPRTPCFRCRLDSTTRAVLLYGVFSPYLGFASAGVAPLSPRCRKLLDETVKTFAFAVLHVVRSIKHERPSLQQMAKWRNLPGVVHWGLHVVVPRASNFFEGLLVLFFLVVVLPTRLSARCLLSSRPDTAFIRSCLLLPLTRGRLAFEQEAVRVFFFSVFSSSSARDGMFPVISDSLRVVSLQALLKFEGPAVT